MSSSISLSESLSIFCAFRMIWFRAISHSSLIRWYVMFLLTSTSWAPEGSAISAYRLLLAFARIRPQESQILCRIHCGRALCRWYWSNIWAGFNPNLFFLKLQITSHYLGIRFAFLNQYFYDITPLNTHNFLALMTLLISNFILIKKYIYGEKF